MTTPEDNPSTLSPEDLALVDEVVAQAQAEHADAEGWAAPDPAETDAELGIANHQRPALDPRAGAQDGPDA